MTRRPRLSPKAREAMWDNHPHASGKGAACCYCPLPIVPGQSWEAAHHPIPHALGGTEMHPAHKRCHAQVTAKETVPQVAKTHRQRRAHIGAKRPGMGHRPLPCGRDTKWKAKIGGGMTPRLSQGQLLSRTKRAREVGKQ